MYSELGITPSALAVAGQYGALLDGFVLDQVDAALASEVEKLGIIPHITNTLMKTINDRTDLAQDVLNFIERILR